MQYKWFGQNLCLTRNPDKERQRGFAWKTLSNMHRRKGFAELGQKLQAKVDRSWRQCQVVKSGSATRKGISFYNLKIEAEDLSLFESVHVWRIRVPKGHLGRCQHPQDPTALVVFGFARFPLKKLSMNNWCWKIYVVNIYYIYRIWRWKCATITCIHYIICVCDLHSAYICIYTHTYANNQEWP